MPGWLQLPLRGVGSVLQGEGALAPHGLEWLYLIANGLVAAAYFTVPVALWYFASKRQDRVYRRPLLLLAALAVLCGAAALFKIWNLLGRTDWLEAYAALLTSVILAICVGALWFVISRLTREQLQAEHNAELMRVKDEVEALNRQLEARVEDRTQALESSNRELAREVVMREYAQQALAASNEQLNHYLRELERQNADVTRLNLLSDQLHYCDSHAEMLRVLERSSHELFGSEGGALLEWRDEQLCVLGEPWRAGIGQDWSLVADALLALRRGRLFPSSIEEQALRPGLFAGQYHLVCAPLQSRGNSIGALVQLRTTPFWSADSIADEKLEQMLRAMADQVALALNNLSLREQLRAQSLSDPLTGLFNRRHMYEQMEAMTALWERRREPFAVIMIDADYFKTFNDRFGHQVGDEVLRRLADMLREQVRHSDVVCRMGGEEFVVLMAGAEERLAMERAEAIRQAVQTLRIAGADNTPVTISVGVALYPSHGDDAHALLAAADRALYQSKSEGRNRVTLGWRSAVPA